MTDLQIRIQQAKRCAPIMAQLKSEQKDAALRLMFELMQEMRAEIMAANALDMRAAQEQKLAEPLMQRLDMTANKMEVLERGVLDVVQLPDPCHQILMKHELARNLSLHKISVPLGVVCVIFESRPDVIPQVLSLMLKSGNVCILKGGREATHSNRAFMKVIEKLNACCPFLPKPWATLLETREEVHEILKMHGDIDLVIPRGSNEMIQNIMANTKIPVLGHADGVCHIFVDDDFAEDQALAVIVDAKTQYPSACNSVETILIHEKVGARFLPQLSKVLHEKGVQLLGCEKVRQLIPQASPVREWHMEYGDLRVSLRVVSDINAAIAHINQHGSHHSDAILSRNRKHIAQFCELVDSASVMVNASTRFADGFRYGFGAEVGISTNKTHARGPVGLEGLVIYKYVLNGDGHTVADYRGPE